MSMVLMASEASALESNYGRYTSGEVRTWETFTYGRFSTKMRSQNKKGTCYAFFTYFNDYPEREQGFWNEIDIEIVPSVSSNPFSTNIIWEWQEQQDQQYCKDFQPGKAFNEYVIEWTPDYVSWKVNGRVCRKTEGTEDVHFLTEAQNLFMDFWTPTFAWWGDDFDDTGMPWYTWYDYVQVESYNRQTGQFELLWRDEFDSFDEDRWFKSNGWGLGSSTFYKDNVYVENGALVFKMDYDWQWNDDGQEGSAATLNADVGVGEEVQEENSGAVMTQQ